MSNRDQIKARIERDKARKAKKQYERAHGTWRAQFNIDLDGLKMRFNEVLRSCTWVWDKNCTPNGCSRKKLRSVETIRRLNLEMSVEDRISAIQPHGEFKWVFTIQNLKKSLQKRRKGVTWKGNVQRFLFHAVLELKRLKDGLLRGELKVDKSIRLIVLHERGKLRKVHAVMIDCRTVQGCLCDSSLIPLTKHKLIRDNPASVKGRGITDARNRLVLFFCELAKKHGDQFFLMTTDFKSFFDSIRHQDCLKVLRESQADLWIQGLGMKINRMYQESELDQIPNSDERAKRKYLLEHNRGVGLTLGSQESQIMAVLVPSPLDHAVKEGANSLRAYERYMDDTLSGHHRKDKLKDVGRTIQKEAAKKGLRLNPRKTIITKASKGIRFLQIHYWVTNTGHLVKELGRQSIVRMRRKLKKFKKRVDAGKMKMDSVFTSFMSWFGNGHYSDSYKSRKKMLNLYNRLFHHYRTEGVFA